MGRLPFSKDEMLSGNGRFEQTQWTVILQARNEGEPGAAEAMETFARTYWPAIYRYIRREGCHAQDAEDLTQGFYAHLLEKQLLNRVGERTGRFRNYLLTCLKHFLSDERVRTGALKRIPKGGFTSRDALEAEERDAVEPMDNLSPDQAFERRWAQAVLHRAQERLRLKYAARKKQDLYEALKDLLLAGKAASSYLEVGQRLGMTESAVKSAASQLRQRFFKCVRVEIERTVGDPREIDEEIRYLISVLAS